MSRAPAADPTAPPHPADPSLELVEVTVRLDGRTILDTITWRVRPGERWVVLGRNGSGKTTLIQVAALLRHPSSGRVSVLGETLGATDVRTLRTRIGLASAAMADRLRPALPALDVVMTARHGALEPWWHTYTDDDRERARALLEQLGIGATAAQPFATLSSGERQRVLLARTLMNDPGLVLLDEPTAGLDLGGREELVAALDDVADVADGATAAPMVLVTHHVEEIPARFTHALLLHQGRELASGPIATTLDSAALSTCFEVDLAIERLDGRWSARAVRPPGSRRP